MNESICLAMNVYNDAAALRGALETGSRFFDQIFIVHSGPGGAYSTDGTIELCEQFGARIVFDDINKGYGVIRTRCIHESGCTFTAVLDADERFFPELPVLHCEGMDYWLPGREKPNLSVHIREGVVRQGDLVRALMGMKHIMAIRQTRRHWYDFTMRTPCRNWIQDDPDHQLRIIRNVPEIHYKSDVKMHEKIWDDRTNNEPVYSCQDVYLGPFIDHFHTFFRLAKPGHKEFNERNYARLQKGKKMIVGEPVPISKEEAMRGFNEVLPK